MSGFNEAAVDRRVEERYAALRHSALESKSLRWLALPPEWTKELADECEFPVDGDLDGLLLWAQELSLCKVRRERTIADLERVRFWVPTTERASLFEEWRSLGAKVSEDLMEISGRILDAPEGVRRKSATGVLRWAELSRDELSSKVVTGESLGQRVADALDEENPAVAAEWVRAGESLGWLLGGEMELAAARARRRLRRHYREAQDARYLAEFVPREEQIEEVEELLGPSEEWAVHFFGQSGVGKTMLMRFLTNRVSRHQAGSETSFCPAARIDFDHVDPHFPLERPTRLLVELADELASHAMTPAQEAAYLAFEAAATSYEAARIEGVEPDLLAALRSRRFARVVGAFADFTKTLPSPVLLILDTCEELAKLHPAGEEVPSVEAMFEIVEQVHAAAEHVLVVFAGRRWLTPEAANMDRRGTATPPAVMSLKPRDYLNMHPVRGFTRDEVVRYLRDARKLSIDDAMVEAVLSNTRDRGKPASWKGTEGKDDGEDRYGPSDVDLYSRWIESDPNLRPADLATGNHDAYVEVRIFKRIESPEVMAAIPAAMLLQRFDWSMIEPALKDGGDPRRALGGLIEQEWTHLEGGPDPEAIVISVDRGLLPRLWDYFDHMPDRRLEVEAARKTLAPHLARLFEGPTSAVRPDQIDAAVRVLDPDDAARLFDRLADQIAAEKAWSWAESVCSLLLAPEREPELPSPLMASACALYVGVLEHRGATADLSALRQTIVARASEHPDRWARVALETRARLGMVAAGTELDQTAIRAALTRGRLLLRSPQAGPAVAPALLAAAEALVDAHEADGREFPADNVSQCLAALAWAFRRSEPARAYLLVLEGRLRSALGDRTPALLAFKRASRMYPAGESGLSFVDWVPPASLHHRILFELLRCRISVGTDSHKFLVRCEAMALKGSGVDAAQLLSLVLHARGARGELNERDLETAERYEESLEGYELTAVPHRCTPPLFASIAECRLALGRPREGLELLLARESASTARRTDGDAARAVVLATLRILRRQRLRERYGLISSRSRSPDPEVRGEAMAAGALIAGLRPPRGHASAEDRVAWRARILLDPRDEEASLTAMRRKRELADDGKRLEAALDRLEAEMVRRRWTRRGRSRVARATREVQALTGSDQGPSVWEPLDEKRLRLRLRRAALLGQRQEIGTVKKARRPLLARLALEEGELMALRLPERATMLLELAEEGMDEAGDRRGAFIAALRGTIADIHAGHEEAAAAAAAGVFRRYAALREVELGLPSLEDLRRGSFQPADSGGDPWHEWVWRFDVYRRWSDEKSERRRDGVPSFEPETELVPAIGAGGIEVRAAVRRSASTAWVMAGICLSLLGVGLVAGIWKGSALTGLLAAAGLVGVVMVGGLAVGFGSLLLFNLGQRFFSSGLPVDGYDLSLVVAPKDGETACAEARLDPWARNRLLQAFLRAVRILPPRSRWTARIPLDEETIHRPLPDALQFAVSRRRRHGQLVPVRLAVTAGLAGLAWERWLLAGLERREGLPPDALPAVWRIRSRGLLALPSEIWPEGVAVLAAPRWRPYIESSAAPGIVWRAGPGQPLGRAAIALGFPALTRAGWCLRLDEDLSLGLAEEAGEALDQDLLSPDWLAAEAPIAVVIGRPGGDPGAEHWSADGLRTFANETSLAGARAVLVVPSLPAERASESIRVITEAIASWSESPARDELRGLTSRLRRAVYEGAGGLDDEERRARYEQALDISLFMPR